MSSLMGLKMLSEALKKEYGYDIKPFKGSSNEKDNNSHVVARHSSGTDFCDGLKLGISYDKNPVLISFFEDFYNCSHEIDDTDAAPYIKKAERYKKIITDSENKIEKALKELKKANVKCERENGYSKRFAFYDNPSISDKVIYYYAPNYTFNGIKISLSDLNNDRLVGYESSLQMYYGDLSKYDVGKFNKRLKSLKKKIKLFPFLKDKYMGEIRYIEDSLKKVVLLREKIDNTEKAIKTFNSLNTNQKVNIRKLLTFLRDYATEPDGYNNNNNFDMIANIYGYNTNLKYPRARSNYMTNDTKRNKYERTLQLMIDKGLLSSERLEEVFKAFSEVYEKVHSGYYHGKLYYRTSELSRYLEMSQKYDLAIKGFMNLMYPGINLNEKFNLEEGTYKKK